MSAGAPVWAAGLLAFRAKPEGGTDYEHTVWLVRATSSEEAAAVALHGFRETLPEQQGWTRHEARVASMAAPSVPERAAVPTYIEVWQERIRQDTMYGPAHDDELTAADWIRRIHRRADLAFSVVGRGALEVEYRRRLVQTAALAIAAIEAFDRGAKLTL